MYEDLIQSNNALSVSISELKKEIEHLELKINILSEFSKGMSYLNPLQYEKLKEELKKIDGQCESQKAGEEGERQDKT